MATEKGSTKSRVDLQTQIRIADFLKSVLKILSEDPPICSYMDGWSDQKVADHLSGTGGAPMTKHNVAGVREALYGKVMVVKLSADTTLVERLARLEEEHANLVDYTYKMNAALQKAIITIGKLELKLKHG